MATALVAGTLLVVQGVRAPEAARARADGSSASLADGAVTTLAGSGAASTSAGSATTAGFNNPHGVVVAAGSLYVGNQDSISKVDLATGATTIFTSSGGPFNINGLATDGSVLYSVGGNFGEALDKTDLASGATSSLHALTTGGFDYHPYGGVAFAGGSVYATAGSQVLQIDPTTGAATTFFALPGSVVGGGIAVDGGSLWVSTLDCSAGCVRGVEGISLSDQSGRVLVSDDTQITMYAMTALGGYVYTSGTPLVNDGSVLVRRYSEGDGAARTVAGAGAGQTVAPVNGTGTDAWFTYVEGLANDGTNLYVADGAPANVVRKIAPAPPLVNGEQVSVNSATPIDLGATATIAPISASGRGVAVLDGYAYVGAANGIEKINLSTGVGSTLVGSANANACSGSVGEATSGSAAAICSPYYVATNGHYLYVTNGFYLMRVLPSTGATSIIAQSIGAYFQSLTVGPDGELYVWQTTNYGPASLLRIDPLSGAQTTMQTLPNTIRDSVAADATSIWTSYDEWYNCPDACGLYFDRIDLATGQIHQVRFVPMPQGQDGAGNPIGRDVDSAAMMVSAGGSLYYGTFEQDSSHGSFYIPAVWSFDKTTSVVTLIAGGMSSGSADGVGPAAAFPGMTGLAADQNRLYVTDGQSLREIVGVDLASPATDARTLGVGGGNGATNTHPCQATTHPVTCSSGDFWHTFTDIAVPGRGGGFGVSRTYNSLLAAQSGPFGFGWACSFCMALNVDGNGNATIAQSNGSQVKFAANGSGGFIPPGDEFTSLAHNADGSYTYTLRAREVFTFNASGALIAASDLDGNRDTYAYTGSKVTSITDAAGRTITVGYGGNGFVSTVTDPLSRVSSYGYDGSGNLASSTDPAGHVTHYTYDANHLMLTMTDPNGGVVTNTFDASGRTLTQKDALNRVTTFAYSGDNFSPAGGSTAITDPTGMVEVENYVNGALTSLTKGFGTPAAATWTYRIDPSTLSTTAVTDPNGHTTSQTFDAAGNVTSGTDADGRITHATFDALNDPLTHTDSAGVTTTYTYTATGDVLSSSTPLGTGAVTTSNTYGNSAHPGDVTSSTDANGHATTLGYDAYGDVSSVTDADGNKSTATFDADGERLTSVAPDGNVTGCSCAAAYTTTRTYGLDRRLKTSTDPLGGVTTIGYDGNGNATSVKDPTLLTTTSTFDADDELTKTTQPDGTYVSYGYDADGRRTSVASGTQPATVTAYDALGDALTVTDPVGKQSVNTYDLGGRLTSSKSANNGTTTFTYFNAGQVKTSTSPTGGVTSRTYDTAGRLATVTDPDGNVTAYAYDALGRQTTTTRADATTTVNGYDSNGNLTSYTDGASKVTSYVYSPAGRETSSTDPDLRVTHFGYDASGHQTTLTDALNRLTTNTFDADGRLTKTVYTGSTTPQVTYTYDAAGRRKTMIDGTGTTTTAYDAFGRIANVTDGAASKVIYTYDSLGRIATLTYPDGHVVTRGYDAADRYTSLTDWNAKTTTFGYDADGNQTTTTYPNAVVDTTTLNAADQPTAITVKNGATSLASFGYTPDPAGQLSTSTDSLAPTLSTSYTYTKLNQVARPASATTTYSYDGSGNLTGLSNGTALTYDAAGQVQTSTPSGGQATTFGFDGVGDRTTTSVPGAGTPGTIGSEVNSNADGVSGAGTVTTSTFSTTHTNEVLVALVSAGPGTGTQTATVSGAGLTWTMVARANTQAGDAEIWSASAPALLASQKVTATQASHGGKLSLEVLSFYGASGVGAHVVASAATGAAHVSVTTTGANSRTFAVGYDGTATGATTVASGQTLTHSQSTSGATGNTWMQKTTSATAASGTAVNLADTAPTTLAWNMAAVEVLATPIPGAPIVTTNTYDQVGELTSTVKTGGAATTYTYNGDGTRATSVLSGVTTKYAWDMQAGVPLLLADATNDYLYGPDGGVVEQVAKTGGTTSYLHADRIGSLRVVSSAAGASVGTASFDPYGNVITRTGTTTAFGYAGQYTDPTGLIYLRARYYDPAIGQLLTIDPLVDTTRQPYAYTAGNPLNATDPAGLDTCGNVHSVSSFFGSLVDCGATAADATGHAARVAAPTVLRVSLDVAVPGSGEIAAHSTVGVCIPASAGVLAGVSGSVCVGVSHLRQLGVSASFGSGWQIPANASVSVQGFWSNASHWGDLGGPFNYYSGGLGPVGGGFQSGDDACGRKVYVASGGVGASVIPVDASWGKNDTATATWTFGQ